MGSAQGSKTIPIGRRPARAKGGRNQDGGRAKRLSWQEFLVFLNTVAGSVFRQSEGLICLTWIASTRGMVIGSLDGARAMAA
jgi:hypothetical protein